MEFVFLVQMATAVLHGTRQTSVWRGIQALTAVKTIAVLCTYSNVIRDYRCFTATYPEDARYTTFPEELW
jgi:hypothetical protein